MLYLICIFVLHVVFCSENYRGWAYINLHCRDNENVPVDWWYLYKPPKGEGPFLETGRNFVFISSDTKGKWVHSNRSVIDNSMLQYTLSPLYRPTYAEHFGSLVFNDNSPKGYDHGTSSNGVLMADVNGGVWVGHSVSGLPNLEDDRATFPVEEFDKGHIMFCFSLSVPTINVLGEMIRKMSPHVTHISIPPIMDSFLKKWHDFHTDIDALPVNLNNAMNFYTPGKRLKGIFVIKTPGETESLYHIFAHKQNVILDVYGHKQNITNFCNVNYGLRKIEKISLKQREDINYINSSIDNMGFAVSTVAHWQETGSGKIQYWACVTTVENFNSPVGGLIVCIENYYVWWNFDNLKVKEPLCDNLLY